MSPLATMPRILPDIIISTLTDNGSPYLLVEAKSGDCSSGFFTLDAVSDILLVKDAVDSFIVANGFGESDAPTDADSPLPGWCVVLEGYLSGYAPADAPAKGVILRTSADIVSDLDDMDDLTVSAVSSAMAQLGFRTHFSSTGAHGWMLRPDPQATHHIRP